MTSWAASAPAFAEGLGGGQVEEPAVDHLAEGTIAHRLSRGDVSDGPTVPRPPFHPIVGHLAEVGAHDVWVELAGDLGACGELVGAAEAREGGLGFRLAVVEHGEHPGVCGSAITPDQGLDLRERGADLPRDRPRLLQDGLAAGALAAGQRAEHRGGGDRPATVHREAGEGPVEGGGERRVPIEDLEERASVPPLADARFTGTDVCRADLLLQKAHLPDHLPAADHIQHHGRLLATVDDFQFALDHPVHISSTFATANQVVAPGEAHRGGRGEEPVPISVAEPLEEVHDALIAHGAG